MDYGEVYIMIKPLKFWCQKVLPAVYDDSLSYYEVLSKINEKLNEVITSENELVTQMSQLSEQMESFDANVEEQINALNESFTAEITNVNSRINGLADNTQTKLDELKDYVDDKLDDKANTSSPAFTGNMTTTGHAWFGDAVKTGGTGYNDQDAKTLATEDYVNDAVAGATGVVIATGSFTPAYQYGTNMYHIKQVGPAVMFNIVSEVDNGTFADLVSNVLGTIDDVGLPDGLYQVGCYTVGSNGTELHSGMATINVNSGSARVNVLVNQADSVIYLNGFYFIFVYDRRMVFGCP